MLTQISELNYVQPQSLPSLASSESTNPEPTSAGFVKLESTTSELTTSEFTNPEFTNPESTRLDSFNPEPFNPEPFNPASSDGCYQIVKEVLQRNRHQLRTPLALLRLYTDLLQATVSDAQAQSWIGQLQTAIEEMSSSLDHLTDINYVAGLNQTQNPQSFKHPQRPHLAGQHQAEPSQKDRYPEGCDLRHVWEHCCQSLHLWIEQKQLQMVGDTQSLWVGVDPWKMSQILQNLLNNAIAFSPIAGQITCRWQIVQADVVLTLSDSGPGLSADDLRELGTKFYSRRPGGTGLGLAIVRQILQDYHGHLWATNRPSGGAEFCVILPRSR
jgi:signal transduction histidine kinase